MLEIVMCVECACCPLCRERFLENRARQLVLPCVLQDLPAMCTIQIKLGEATASERSSTGQTPANVHRSGAVRVRRCEA